MNRLGVELDLPFRVFVERKPIKAATKSTKLAWQVTNEEWEIFNLLCLSRRDQNTSWWKYSNGVQRSGSVEKDEKHGTWELGDRVMCHYSGNLNGDQYQRCGSHAANVRQSLDQRRRHIERSASGCEDTKV